MIITVGEMVYLVDRISKMDLLAKKRPDFVQVMQDVMQDLKDSFTEAGENYEDYLETEVEISIDKIADAVEEGFNQRFEAE